MIETTMPHSKEIIQANKHTCWLVDDVNKFVPSYTTIPQLPAGKYKIRWNSNQNKYGFIKEEINVDELLELPNNVFKEVLNDIDYFWNNKKLFDDYNFVYKRGILLWGNPGCGKSSLLALLSKQVIERGGIVLSIQSYDDLERYQNELPNTFRIIQPDTPVLTTFEDLDSLVNTKETETMLLNILDGLNQSNNVVNIGCTNYPENLKERILNRPSRFDKKYYIGFPDHSVRKFYFENKIKQEDIEKMGGEQFLVNIVDKTEGLTLAHLGEFIKSVFIFNNSVEDTINLLHDMKKVTSSKNNDGNKAMGFKS